MQGLDSLQGDDLAAEAELYSATLHSLEWKLEKAARSEGRRIAHSDPPNAM